MSEVEFLDKTSDEFKTPPRIFDPLMEEFNFTIDAAASASNAVLPRYVTKEQDAFNYDFCEERVWCNPPYSKPWVERFVRLGWEWSRRGKRALDHLCCETPALLWVLLVPTRTEQSWFHELKGEAEVRFVRGRIQFIGGAGHARDNHMLVIFRNRRWLW